MEAPERYVVERKTVQGTAFLARIPEKWYRGRDFSPHSALPLRPVKASYSPKCAAMSNMALR